MQQIHDKLKFRIVINQNNDINKPFDCSNAKALADPYF